MNFEISQGVDMTSGIKTVIYGVEGIGKTLLASRFPDPLFIDTEGSTTHYGHIKRLPKPKDWKEINQMVDFVAKKKPCQTLVIDTFDWAEMAEVADMLQENKWKSIESAGYGKGYILSAERIGLFLKDLEDKLIKNGINVVLNCHAQIRKIELPEEQGSFDKYELKLGNKTSSRTSPLVKEWADLMLFCNYKTFVESSGEGSSKKSKAIGGTERVMYATRSAVWDAKNRFGLPEEMSLDFKNLQKVFAAKPEKVEAKKPEAKPEQKEEPKTEPKPERIPAITYPDNLPDGVADFLVANGIRPDTVQEMIYREGIVKSKNFPLSRFPKKFWMSLMEEFEERWSDKLMDACTVDLPF